MSHQALSRRSYAAVSLQVFSLYLLTMGIVIALVPQLLTSILALPDPGEPYPRMIGIIMCALAYYYHVSAVHEFKPMIQATIYMRALIPVLFAGLVIMDVAEPIFMIFSLTDALGALTTCLAFRRDLTQTSSSASVT